MDDHDDRLRRAGLLDRLAVHVEGHTGVELRYLFSRGGFSDRLQLVTPADAYR